MEVENGVPEDEFSLYINGLFSTSMIVGKM